MTLNELKLMFDSLNNKRILVDWDGGHCYTYVEFNDKKYSDLRSEFEVNNPQSDMDELTEYEDEWMYENDDYCKYCDPGCCCEENPDIDYIKGFISLYKEMGYDPTLYHQHLLDKIKLHDIGEQIHEELGGE